LVILAPRQADAAVGQRELDVGEGSQVRRTPGRDIGFGPLWSQNPSLLALVGMSKIPDKPSLSGLEAKWDTVWEATGVYRFRPQVARDAGAYSIDTPPPTVSGLVHLGTVFGYVQTDAMARFNRMMGKEVFYPIGWDDNGLPTERRVQQVFGVRCDPSLAYEESFELTAEEQVVSRRRFIELCEMQTEADERDFEAVFRGVGLSVDWAMKYSTIDDNSRAVSQAAFLENLARGEAYADEAPTIWDVDFQTAVAQAEIEDREVTGALYRVFFRSAPSDELLEVETTRPELLPACVGLVVHPDDGRHKALVGTEVVTPVFDVPVPVLEHELVDPSAGTGVVMVCTFGDLTDVVWWRELALPIRSILSNDGRLKRDVPEWITLASAREAWGQVAGLRTKQARRVLGEVLSRAGHLAQPPRQISHAVPFYEKGENPVEIVTSRQWWIRNGHEDAKLSAALLEAGRRLDWHPPFMRHRYEDWVRGLNTNWLISRQRYFGVPFPVWYPVDEEGEVQWDRPMTPDVSDLPIDPETDCPAGYQREQRGKPGGFVGESDVMDTWATSSLTPQIATGWFDDPELFELAFPMDLRPQGPEIIRTWLFATLLRSHLEHGTLPWTSTMINGWILDPDRKKMSKSKGNVTTPGGLVEQYGADGVRYWACCAAPGTDTAADPQQMRVGRRLAMKVLNASRFALRVGAGEASEGPITDQLDRSLLAQLADVVEFATSSFATYQYHRALKRVEDFFWTYCDDYIELVKDRAYGEGEGAESAKRALAVSLSCFLRLLAPVLPFVTEEVWSWWQEGSIHQARWPTRVEVLALGGDAGDPAVLSTASDVLGAVRKAKSVEGVSQRHPVARVGVSGSPDRLALVEAVRHDLASGGSITELSLHEAATYRVEIRLAADELASRADDVRS